MRPKRSTANYETAKETRDRESSDTDMEDESTQDISSQEDEASDKDLSNNHHHQNFHFSASKSPASSTNSSDLTNLTTLEAQTVSNDHATILRNWSIAKLTDMLQSTPKQWLKGTNGSPDFEPETVRAFAELSELTKGKRHQVQRDLAKIYGHRYHSQQGFRKGVGRTWGIKQVNIRQDIRTLIERVKEAEVENEEDEEDEPVPRKGDVRKAANSTNKRPTNDDLPARPIAIYPPRKRHRPNTSPPPATPLDPATQALISTLRRNWTLTHPLCIDAIPAHVPHPWAGLIQHWGSPPGSVLRALCDLSAITPGRHGDVIAKLTELATRRRDGLQLADLEEAQMWFKWHGDFVDEDEEGTPELNIANDASIAFGVAIEELRTAEEKLEGALQERRGMETDWMVGEARIREADVMVREARLGVARADAGRARCRRWVDEMERLGRQGGRRRGWGGYQRI